MTATQLPPTESKPFTFSELKTLDQQSFKESEGRLEKIIKSQVERCNTDPKEKESDLTFIIRQYLLEQKTHILRGGEIWTYWVNYFMTSIALGLPLENKRYGAWALIALSTKHQAMGVLHFTGERRLQKCFETLRIPFSVKDDLITDSATLTSVLCPRILRQIAVMFNLPTDFNEKYGSWERKSSEEDFLDITQVTRLIIPPFAEFEANCEEKRRPFVLGQPDPYRR